jgi:prepilin-type N-terminal cleavage/methylation domain-containing protein
MFSKLKRSESKGFTIIEVMIVLAIAGLIMLIVFLAVPALQRTARNTQRKSDASAVAAAVANFSSNNGGALPTSDGFLPADTTTLLLFCKGGGPAGVTVGQTVTYASSPCTATNTNSESAKQGYYLANSGNYFFDTVNTGYTAHTSATVATALNINTESMTIVMGYGCNGTNSGISTTPNPRTAAVLYATETSGGASLQCIEQ